ncbi:MAG: 3-isopropylmalate dehydratase small subunit [Gammaproteobacteria bacterium]
MEPLIEVAGVAAPLPQANVDTDVIMPKQFLKGITRDGLARGLFYDLRFDSAGRPREDFILNQSAYHDPAILIVGPNFGCGSSREHAVWGLKQFGVRCLLGASFASIFQDNCFRNGVLPIALSVDQVGRLQGICSDPTRNRLRVDLLHQCISAHDGVTMSFDCDALRRDDLLNGRDAIASTLQFCADIRDFERVHWASKPWLMPVRS